MSGARPSLRVQRIIAATPRQVFDAWTTPAELARWWTPPGGRCLDATIDLRPGGCYSIVNELPGGHLVTIRGKYTAIEPPTLLRFTWTTGGDQHPTETVTIGLEPIGDATEVTVVHARIPDNDVLKGHMAGWTSCLDGLVAHCTSQEPR